MKGLRRRATRSAEAVEKQIAAALADVSPMLRIEHWRFEIGGFEPASGELTLRIEGNCPDCLGSPAMFAKAIEAHVKLRVPTVRSVRIVDGS